MRAFCIYLNAIPSSVQLANRCVDSGADHGQLVERFSGVTGKQAKQVFLENDVPLVCRPDAHGTPERYRSLSGGQTGCAGSHFLMWKKCIELCEPILIMEHDATIIAKIPDVEFKEVLNLQSNTWDNPEWKYHQKIQSLYRDKNVSAPESGLQPARYTTLPGASGYMVNPTGARKLVQGMQSRGPYLADIFVNKSLVEIEDFWPRPIVTLHGPSTVTPRRLHNPPE